MIDEKILKREERAILALRSLYRTRGYLPYKMSKFEEYEYYIRNKDFLVSDRIITFNDTSGRLMALKPDVTLSIIKHFKDCPGWKQKVCYNENIYRVSDSTGQYKEIMQAGLECIGDIDLYDIFEALSLAAGSLALMGSDFILQISHMGLISAVLDQICPDPEFRQAATGFIAGKNTHDLARLCAERNIPEERTRRLCRLVEVYGERSQVLKALEEAFGDLAPEPLEELKALSALLDTLDCGENILFDFSVVHDMNYYNGIVFKGYLSGVSEGILAGGQYDRLMQKMGHSAGAVGFALYLDLLEQLPGERRAYDVDVLLLCEPGDDPAGIARTAACLAARGETVTVQKCIPDKLRYRRMIRYGKEDV